MILKSKKFAGLVKSKKFAGLVEDVMDEVTEFSRGREGKILNVSTHRADLQRYDEMTAIVWYWEDE